MGAVVSLDGFIADDNDGVGPLFDWYDTLALGLIDQVVVNQVPPRTRRPPTESHS